MDKRKQSEVLYHYCSVKTFREIIKNKTLWLTDVNKMNDPMERKWIYDSLIKLCKAGEIFEGKKAYFEEYKQYILKDYSAYAFCLSERKDLLSQWRGYGDNGKGISVGFSRAKLIDNTFSGRDLELKKVDYNAKNRKVYVSEIFKRIGQGLTEGKGDREVSIPEDVFSAVFIAELINSNNLFYKVDFFKEEKEWRLVFADNVSIAKSEKANWFSGEKGVMGWISKDSIEKINGCRDIKIEKLLRKDKTNETYIEFDFKDVANDLIEEIILGPAIKPGYAPKEIKKILTENGIDLPLNKIKYSKGKLRV